MYVSVAHSSASVDQSKPLNDTLNFDLTERNTIQMHCNDSGKSSVKMTNYSKPVVTKSERKFPYNIHQNQLGFNSSNALLLGEYANQRKSQDTTCLFSRNWRITELPEKNHSQKSRKKKAKSDYRTVKCWNRARNA